MGEKARYTFAIGDIHGRFDLLQKALDWIEDAATPFPVINVVFTGDYVDRGPNSRAVVERLRIGLERPQDRLHCLMGNHEEMLIRAARRRPDLWDHWIANGGRETVDSYGGEVTPEHLGWLRSLPLSYSDEHRYFVHAGINPRRTLEDQTDYDRLWIRDRFLSSPGPFEKHIVHGHTPKEDGPELLSHRTNLDVGAVFTGRLVIAVFDSLVPGGPTHIHSVREAG